MYIHFLLSDGFRNGPVIMTPPMSVLLTDSRVQICSCLNAVLFQVVGKVYVPAPLLLHLILLVPAQVLVVSAHHFIFSHVLVRSLVRPSSSLCLFCCLVAHVQFLHDFCFFCKVHPDSVSSVNRSLMSLSGEVSIWHAILK